MAGLNTGQPITIYADYLPSSQTEAYEVGTGKYVLITEISLVNSDAGQITPDIRVVPDGETNGPEYRIHNSVMASGEDRCIPRGTKMSEGDKVFLGDGDGAAVACRITGIEFDAA